MPYFTVLPNATIDLTANTPVVDPGSILLLNRLGGSTEFNQYDVEASGVTTLDQGDGLSLVDSDGGALLSGASYAGTGTLSTAALGLRVPGLLGSTLASLTVQVNPISGSYVMDGDGTAYFVTDAPLDQDHISASITGTVLGLPLALANVNISDLGSALPGGKVVLSAVQGLLDTAVVNLSYDPNGTLDLDDGEVFPCFTAGTLIDTPQGPMAVEGLAVGDQVLTADHGAQAIRWIGRRRFGAERLSSDSRLVPIRIRAGALGLDTPARDLLVSPQHRILVRSRIAARMFGTDEILVAAKQLLPVAGIEEAHDLTEIEYIHILFDRHEVIRANGTETESLYLGTEAFKALPPKAVDEILTIFPELRESLHAPACARPLVRGLRGRKLAARHVRNHQPLIMS